MAEANTSLPSDSESQERPVEDMSNTEIAETDTSGMDRFLQKSRSELMYELRRIQHGDRPVTGSDSRENIDRFFAKHLETPAGSEGKRNIPANVDEVEEHRPQAIVVEVQGLFEQQRVSSVLRSTAFRRSLERIIRGSIAPSTAPRLPRPRAAPPVPAQRTTIADTTQETEDDGRSRSLSHESLVSDSSSSSSSSSSANGTSPARVPSPVDHVGDNIAAAQVNGGHAPPAEPTWQEISQYQHDNIIQEISELLHTRLVSSTLDGEFRGTLEIQMQNRLATSGTNGEDVEHFVRNLPHPDHVRNDFSHLGLAQGQDNWDNISVTSFSATAIPASQSTLQMNRELRSLRSEMQELKNMLKLSFDLQLDIQRAIRQEVAAAVSQATGADGAAAIPLPKQTRPVNDTHCLICLEHEADSVLYQCGHLCLCHACGKHLLSLSGKCPVCRAPIRDVIRAYKCNQD